MSGQEHPRGEREHDGYSQELLGQLRDSELVYRGSEDGKFARYHSFRYRRPVDVVVPYSFGNSRIILSNNVEGAAARKLSDYTDYFEKGSGNNVYADVNPIISRDEERVENLSEEIKALDTAFTMLEDGERYFRVENSLRWQLREETFGERFWKAVRKLLGAD
ncbi:MAG: hypothetical protein ABEK16_05205 [Candidatus Nanohalobium sp.]